MLSARAVLDAAQRYRRARSLVSTMQGVEDGVRDLFARLQYNQNKLTIRMSDGRNVSARSITLVCNDQVCALRFLAVCENVQCWSAAPLEPSVAPSGVVFHFTFYRRTEPSYGKIQLLSLIASIECVRARDDAVRAWPMPRELCELVLAYAPPWDYGGEVLL